MEILSGLDALADRRVVTPIVTWGVFDGVHLGHRRILESVVTWAREEGVPSLAATFNRHPVEVLSGRRMLFLTPIEERMKLIAQSGVDFGLVMDFTPGFARLSAEAFVRDVVAGRMRARGIVLGYDARFGRERAGTFEMLKRLGDEMGIGVRQCAPELFRGQPVSSSLIREAILAGRLEESGILLGRPLTFIGTIVRGERRGNKLGFPTANLELEGRVRPPSGVYAVEAMLEGAWHQGVANLGTRPTFHRDGVELLEVHLLDLKRGDLYGKMLEVRFLARVRGERKFENVAALKKQIGEDIAFVRAGCR